jgi:hypothetical protein
MMMTRDDRGERSSERDTLPKLRLEPSVARIRENELDEADVAHAAVQPLGLRIGTVQMGFESCR